MELATQAYQPRRYRECLRRHLSPADQLAVDFGQGSLPTFSLSEPPLRMSLCGSMLEEVLLLHELSKSRLGEGSPGSSTRICDRGRPNRIRTRSAEWDELLPEVQL